MRQTADPVADAVVEAIYREGSIDAVNKLLASIFRTDEPIPPGLPEVAVRYFEDTSKLPGWADPWKIAAGARLFTRAGWSIGGALFCSSLPQAYASAHGARVLVQTQGMTKHVNQRIFETAQFLFDAIDEGALAPGGRGIRSAQRVRLMHAGIRHLLRARKDPPWDSARLGVPVNQEDLVGTLMTFSVIPLEALALLGEQVSPSDAEAWIHTWNVVGALLGIRPELFPNTVADGTQLKLLVQSRQWGSSEDGRLLTRALVRMMQVYLPLPARALPVAMIRRLCGDRCAEILGLPTSLWRYGIDALVWGMSPIERVMGVALQRRLFAPFTHFLMKGVVLAEREGKQARFRLPASLRRAVEARS
jgi:hypothetical protein